MRAVYWAIAGIVGVVILLLVGILAGRVGGIAIRREGAEAEALVLQVSQPVVRGVPVIVHWTETSPQEAENVSFFWRDSETELLLGEGARSSLEVPVIFPCDNAAASGTLVARAQSTRQVLGTAAVTMAVPGPECVQ